MANNYNNSSNAITNQFQIEKALADMDKGTANDGEALSAAASSIANNLGKDNHFSPLIAGFAAGAGVRGAKERRNETSAKQQALEKLSIANKEIVRRSQEIDRFNSAKEIMSEQFAAFVEMAPKFSPNERKTMMQDLFNQFNYIAGTDYRLISQDSENLALVTYSDKGGTHAMDLRRFASGTKLSQEDMAKLLPNTIKENNAKMEKEQKEFALKEKQYQLDKEKQDLEKLKTDPKYLLRQESIKNAAKQQQGAMIDIDRQISTQGQIAKIAQEMKDIVTRSPDILQSIYSVVLGNQSIQNTGISSTIMQNIVNGMNEKKADDATEFVKRFNDLIKIKVQGLDIGRLNQFIETIVAKTVPGFATTPNTAIKLLGEEEKNALSNQKKYQDQFDLYNANTGIDAWRAKIKAGSNNTNTDVNNQATGNNVAANPPAQQNIITLKSPTGQVVRTVNDQNLINEATKQGWVVVNE